MTTGPIELFPAGMADRRPWHGCCSLLAGLGEVTVVSPSCSDMLRRIIEICHDYRLAICPLGAGTNLVGSDEELAVVALRLGAGGDFDAIQPVGNGTFDCGSAMPLSRLLTELARRGFGGAASLSGIPGTLGGCVVMNAGANGLDLSRFVRRIDGIKLSDGSPWEWREEQGGWGYRQSPVPAGVLVTGARLAFQDVEPTTELQAISAEKQRRGRVTPHGASAGSVFKNPGEGLEPAGRLLEQCDCKGLTAGVFQVSEQHANWIVNPGRRPGAAADCRQLVETMRHRVLERFGIRLDCEWRWAGKDEAV